LTIAKDVWMLGIGLGLITKGVFERETRAPTSATTARRARRTSRS
jgi:hypothetical protein